MAPGGLGIELAPSLEPVLVGNLTDREGEEAKTNNMLPTSRQKEQIRALTWSGNLNRCQVFYILYKLQTFQKE